jgi:hypothetical protein
MKFSTHRGMGAAMLGLICAMPVHDGRAEEGWQVTLKLQLDLEKKCHFERMVWVRQLPVEQLGALEGRVRCEDGREFEFSRSKAHLKFELRMCMPAIC